MTTAKEIIEERGHKIKNVNVYFEKLSLFDNIIAFIFRKKRYKTNNCFLYGRPTNFKTLTQQVNMS